MDRVEWHDAIWNEAVANALVHSNDYGDRNVDHKATEKKLQFQILVRSVLQKRILSAGGNSDRGILIC